MIEWPNLYIPPINLYNVPTGLTQLARTLSLLESMRINFSIKYNTDMTATIEFYDSFNVLTTLNFDHIGKIVINE